MKHVINNLYYEALRDLQQMKLSEMKLSERIKYERALIRLDALKKILDQYELSK